MVIKTSSSGIEYNTLINSSKIPLSIRLLRGYYRLLNSISSKFALKFLLKLFLTPKRRIQQEKQMQMYKSGNTEFIDFEGKEVFVFTRGEGPKVLLLHGWSSNSYLFRAAIDELTKQGNQQ